MVGKYIGFYENTMAVYQSQKDWTYHIGWGNACVPIGGGSPVATADIVFSFFLQEKVLCQ